MSRPAKWVVLTLLALCAVAPVCQRSLGDDQLAQPARRGATTNGLWRDWNKSRVVSFQLADDPAPRDVSAPTQEVPRKASEAQPMQDLSVAPPPARVPDTESNAPTDKLVEDGVAEYNLAADGACEISGSCDACASSGKCCCDPTCGRWFHNTELFIAGDGWKNIFDDDDNNNFGFRGGFNMGIDLPGRRALRGQLGASYGAYDFHGREALLSRDDPIEQQLFVTAGIYKRSNVTQGDPFAWGAVYDLLISDEAGERADSLRLGQVRGYVGHALRKQDEVGVWIAMRVMNDHAEKQNVQVNVTDQANLFWHHHWLLGGDTTAYVGWADDPGDVVIGLNGRAPLNRRVAIFGNAHYIIPSTTGGDVHPTLRIDDTFSQESWNVSFGLVFYLGGKAVARDVSGVCGLPLLSVADNSSMSYQADMIY